MIKHETLIRSTAITANGLQPYADAKGWQVRKGICVKGAVSGSGFSAFRSPKLKTIK